MRISISALTLRRNLLEDLTFSGGLVKSGDFVAYSLADVHLNPEIYLRPNEFDPNRFLPGREEDKKGTFSYLGWGAGAFPFFFFSFFCFLMNFMNLTGGFFFFFHRTSSLHRNESCKIGN